jgi:predicted ATPase
MHEPHLTQVTIPRPNHLGGGQWSLSNLTTINVVFGKNGSGKSLLLRAWRDNDPANCHYIVPERGGEIDYQAQYFQQQVSANERQGNSQRNFVDQYRRQIVARIQAYFSVRGNSRSGQLPGNPADLETLLGQLLPDFTIQLTAVKNPPYILLRASDNSPVGAVDQLSSGETQLLTIALDILTIAAMWEIQGTTTRIVLIDEPDAHIHPDLQARFADFLVTVVKKYKLQVVLATHSTTLLAGIGQFGGEAASVLYVDRIKAMFRAEPFTRIMKELAACLGGHALMAPLFGVPIFLIEGDDDYRIWSQVPRHHVVSISVIPSHGEEIKQYQKSLERMFAALREGQALAGYALLDGDKAKPQPSERNPQNHVRFLQLACHESENLYLTDEVLALLGITWAEAAEKLTVQAVNHGNKAAQLQQAATWDRRNADIKNLIDEISIILDEKRVHWTVRVANVIGRTRPSGQLGEFLGTEVVVSLWGQPPLITQAPVTI